MIGRKRLPEGDHIKLPAGFRFNPTDEELVVHYLCKRASSQLFPTPIIADLDLYKFDPWDLPDKALFGENEWYFFTPRYRKYPNGQRPDRFAGSGYWKATGTDKPITTSSSKHLQQIVGVKKSLVFYRGKPPQGVKTNWIMHEYRLPNAGSRMPTKNNGNLRLDDWVLCRVYEKASSATKVAKDMLDYHRSYMDGVASTNSSSSKKPECSTSSGLGSSARANPSNICIDADNDDIISSTYHYRTNSSHVCKVESGTNNKDYINTNFVFDTPLGACNWMTNTPTTRPTLGMGLFNLEGLLSPFGRLDSILSPPLCGVENGVQYRDI